MKLGSPEHSETQNAKAFAYVRPHDFEVERYSPGAQGIAATLDRAIVIGPIARLELLPQGDQPAGKGADESLIEVQIPSQQYREMGLREGDMLVLTPRNVRVFVEAGEGI